MRTFITGLLTAILSLAVFFPTAFADVIDPGNPNPYRRPPRPSIPVTKVYKMRAPDFTLTKTEETGNTYLLQATLPGPCKWKYTVQEITDGPVKEVARGGMYSVPELTAESDSRKIVLEFPEGKDKAKFVVDVEFLLYQFQETSFGPKVCGEDYNTLAVMYIYELDTVDGKPTLKKL